MSTGCLKKDCILCTGIADNPSFAESNSEKHRHVSGKLKDIVYAWVFSEPSLLINYLAGYVNKTIIANKKFKKMFGFPKPIDYDYVRNCVLYHTMGVTGDCLRSYEKQKNYKVEIENENRMMTGVAQNNTRSFNKETVVLLDQFTRTLSTTTKELKSTIITEKTQKHK